MSVGKLNIFEVNKDSWDSYIDRQEQYFIVNDISEERKVATLITVIGNDAYELMVNLCTPVKPATMTFAAIAKIMKDHLQPKISILAERYKFRLRKQRSEESISDYVAELKKMSKSCEFGTSLGENLRDQFVCGVGSDAVRQRLFAEEDLKFDKACKLAMTMEANAAEANAAIVDGTQRYARGEGSPATAVAVHRAGVAARHTRDRTHPGGGTGRSTDSGWRAATTATRRRPGPAARERALTACRCCGETHETNSCKFKAYVCKVCNQDGHLKRMCPRLQKGTEHYYLEGEAHRDGDVAGRVGGVGGHDGDLSGDSDGSSDEFQILYCDVFSPGLGRFSGGTVGLRLRPDARPVYMRARPLAYALREPVERALDSLVADGIITPVETSDWATPIVPVVKKDGTIRICGDFKITLNRVLEVDRFPVPKVDDLLARLYGGERFSKIDLSQAYAQFILDDTKIYTVINTHKGLFRYNRLSYGLASSPGIFQRKLEQLFSDVPFVGVFLDDVIISGKNYQEHISNLHKVFERLQKFGLKIRKDKCAFFKESVTYLGFVINKEGVHTCPEKIKAIAKVATPQNVSELRAFLGLVMYYAKFVPKVSTILEPLYQLLKKQTPYEWNDRCELAFKKIKSMLTSSEILMHYSLDLPLLLTTDASSVGVGAVLSHLLPAGGTRGHTERPVAYASRVLNAAERAYSQIDKEALAIVYGVRKFHQYLYGRKFILRTDHKPLVSIFGSKAGIPVTAASRMQRWAVLLSGYDYDIEYVRSNCNGADALSRLPMGEERREAKETTYLNFVQNFLPVTKNQVKTSTESDQILKRVVLYLQSAWPNSCENEDLKPYFTKRNELYLDMGCVMWGYRLVIPADLQDKLLDELHVGHFGIVKMKSVARSYVWWPGIDDAIERRCSTCAACVAEAAAPARAPPQPWPYTSEPWSRLHIDFLGPYRGNTFLIIVDSSTKWIEAFLMRGTTATAVIRVLRETFARFGIPKEIVSDNGPPFSSKEYSDFMINNGIKLSFSPVYHPSSNGAAENAVKLCKRAVKKSFYDGTDIETSLQAYLLAYRNVAHNTTGAAPAVLLQRRNLRSRLDLLRGDRAVEERVLRTQNRQIENTGGTLRQFKEGEEVWMRVNDGKDKWSPGQIQHCLGSRNYLVASENGPPVKRHIDQLKRKPATLFDMPCPSSPSRSRSPPLETLAKSVMSDDGSRVQTSGRADQPAVVSGSPLQSSAESLGKRPRRPINRYGFEFD